MKFYVFLLLSFCVLGTAEGRRHHRHPHRYRVNHCPVKQKLTPGCQVVPRNAKPGQARGIAAFRYIEGRINAPSQWANLNCRSGPFRAFRNCDYCLNIQCGGNSQSPINVKTNNLLFGPSRAAPRLFLPRFTMLKYTIAPNNFKLECSSEGRCGYTYLKNRRFVLNQVHVHRPSEHWLNDRRFPLEMHFVHKSGNGNLLVLGLFFRRGRYNHQLQKFMNIASRRCKGFMNLRALTKRSFRPRNIVAYIGSTTAPPCVENVNWVISTRPLTASSCQIRQFLRLMGNINVARPIQPLNGRMIISYK